MTNIITTIVSGITAYIKYISDSETGIKIYTGEEFNILFFNTNDFFVLMINFDDLNIGINENKIYNFSLEQDIILTNPPHKFVAHVNIPDDSIVTIYWTGRMVSNKINVSDIFPSFELYTRNYANEIMTNTIETYPYLLKTIPDYMVSKEYYKYLVSQNAFMIRYVPDEVIDYELCKIAFIKYPNSIKYIPEKFIDQLINSEMVKSNFVLSG